jgi:allophanate hydrolase
MQDLPDTLSLASIAAAYKNGATPTQLVTKFYSLWEGKNAKEKRCAAPDRWLPADNKHAWVVLAPLSVLLKRCAELELQKEHERGELWGVPFGVKDNVHYPAVGPTTCACTSFKWEGPTSVVVEELVRQGGIVAGKTNMDQFAAGLNGTRTPHGTARNAFDDRFIPGGSSSGSGALVGSGVLPFALGTDTAGSGRVPAAFNGCYGLKGTVGLVSTEGVVPACRSLDCLTVFAVDPVEGRHLQQIMSRPRSRASPSYRALPTNAPRRWQPGNPFRFGVPQAQFLDFGGPGGTAVTEASQQLFAKAIARLERLGGHHVKDFDFSPFAETAQMLYGNAFIAERTAGVHTWLTPDPATDERMEKILRVIMSSGKKFTAVDAFDGMAQLSVKAASKLDRVCMTYRSAELLFRISCRVGQD